MSEKQPYLTSPIPSTGMPPGVPYIIGNEAAERFSFYGMKAILTIFMTKYLVDSFGYKDVMNPEEAKTWFHLFTSAVYFTPIFGAILSDYFLGKYKTIISLSIVYCLGHLALALDDTRLGLSIGLTLIAIGAGGIKPCVSANVGDQFGKTNQHLLEKVYAWFYFSINFGAFFSTIMTPYVLRHYGPNLAFGIPGGLMLLATWMFWLGRRKFVHIPPGGKAFVQEVFSGDGLKSVGNLFVIYLFVAMFWALFDQTGSAWVLQAEKMDLDWLGITWLSSQIQAINPILIMVFIPIFTFAIYPSLNKMFKLTPLRKIAIGMFLTVPAFLIPAWIESRLHAGFQPNIVWQLVSYVILTAAEVFVSITCLEFSYTQAPKKMKSFVMAFFLMSVSAGNLFVAGVNFVIQKSEPLDKKTAGTLQVTPQKTTIYELTCQDKKKSVRSKHTVTIETPRPAIKELKVNDSEDELTVKVGTEVTLSWKTNHTKACTLHPDNLSVPVSGTKTVKIEKKTTFLLDCQSTNNALVHAKRRITVLVGSESNKPKVLTFAANKTEGKILTRPDRKVELTWKAAHVKSCSIKSVDKTFDKTVATSGSLAVATENKVYLLECETDSKVKVGARLKVQVEPGVSIDAFTLNGGENQWFPKAGASVTLAWKTSDAASCALVARTTRLDGVQYYLFFAGAMLLTALLFLVVAARYKEHTYIQDEEPAKTES